MKQTTSGECLQLPLLDIFNNKYQADDDYFQEISLIIKSTCKQTTIKNVRYCAQPLLKSGYNNFPYAI